MSEEKLEEINSIAEFMDKLNKVKELERYKNLEIVRVNNKTYKYTIDLFYRGHSSNYELKPSIERLRENTFYSIFDITNFIITQAKSEYPVLFSETDNPLELLFKLQHYGIPTRLLDITANPLVALYFVCRNYDKKDGEFFVFGSQFEKTRKNIIGNSSLTYLARSDLYSFNTIDIISFISTILNDKFIINDIDNFIDSNKIDDIMIDTINELHFIYPPKLFDRLTIQQGKFILYFNDYFYDEINKNIIHNRYLSPIPKDHKNIIARYIIPAESKKHLLEELKMLNITESTLFHDNIDKVCENIVADFKGRHGKKWYQTSSF